MRKCVYTICMQKKIRKLPILPFLFSLFVTFVAGGVGQLFTYKEISTWYASLHKPAFTPPNSIFGPVWTSLYFLMALSLTIILQKNSTKRKTIALELFFVQLVLNSLWSIIFFGFHQIQFALTDIIVLFIFIMLTLFLFWKLSKTAAILLAPYLVWVGFASILNLFIFILN